MEYIENRTFDEIEIGASASVVRTLSQADIELFAVMSGDVNPAHLDAEYARSDMFQKVIAHGMWGGALISSVLGTMLPGPGTIYLGQTLRFRRPVGIGDTVTVTVKATEKESEKKVIVFDCLCTNQHGKPVIEGTATVRAPTEKVRRPRPVLPEVLLHDHGAKLRAIVDSVKDKAPLRTAVTHPVHDYSIASAVEMTRAGLISPILIGPEDRIRAAAGVAAVDISDFPVVATEHSGNSAATAVAMARAGEVDAIMMADRYVVELLRIAVARHTGVRTARRMSHVVVADVPYYPRLLLVTDAFINTDPSVEDKKDIVCNAIDLAHALGIANPKVALIAATHTVENHMRSTMEAAAVCKMGDRGQITGAVLEGPLTYDMAVSEKAATRRGVTSPVIGTADVVVCPDLEAAHLLHMQLTSQARAVAASVILGARVPIVLPSQGDEALSRLASCALAVLMHEAKKAASEPTRPQAAV